MKMGFQEIGWKHRLDLCGLGYGQVAGYFEYGNELPSSINAGYFLPGW